MKRVILIICLAATIGTAWSQEVSSRAKAIRMLKFAKPEYQVKDIKIFADTMTIYSLSNYVVYPFGVWDNVEQFITNSGLQWYRESGYKQFYDTMSVSVNTMKRLDGSYLDIYRSIWTNKVEMVGAKITDPEIVLNNGLKVGATKQEVFDKFFKKHPKSYTLDVTVIKIISGASEVGEVYTFKGNKLRKIEVVSKYKYY